METSRKLASVVAALTSVTLVLANEESPDSRDWRDYPDFSSLRQEIGWRDDFSNICEAEPPFNKMGDLIRGASPAKRPIWGAVGSINARSTSACTT